MNKQFVSLGRVQREAFSDVVIRILFNKHVNRGVAEVSKVGNFIVDWESEERQICAIAVFLHFPWKRIENFSVESTAGAVVFKDLDDEIAHVVVFDNFFFKILSTNFFDSSCLSQLFSLVEHLQVVIQELVNQLLQVFLNLVKHN